jgi:hypothetical protein
MPGRRQQPGIRRAKSLVVTHGRDREPMLLFLVKAFFWVI